MRFSSSCACEAHRSRWSSEISQFDVVRTDPLSHGDLKDVDLWYADIYCHVKPRLIIFHELFRNENVADLFERFGKKLRVVREKTGISQEKLAELAGLHRTYVSSVERGKRNISIENIERLALALGVQMKDLMPDPP
jgi:DNA-binding XRE family transcriptional regulator